MDISSVESLETVVQTWAILQVNPCKLYSVSYYKLQKGISGVSDCLCSSHAHLCFNQQQKGEKKEMLLLL